MRDIVQELRDEAGDGSLQWGGPVRCEMLARAADTIETERRNGEAARDCIRALIGLLDLAPDATYDEVTADVALRLRLSVHTVRPENL